MKRCGLQLQATPFVHGFDELKQKFGIVLNALR